MTFDSQEGSAAASQPVELYDFFSDSGEHWRYTSNSETQFHLEQEYEPDIITRKAIEITENQFKNLMEITLGRNNAFAIQYIIGVPENKIGVTIYRYQGTDYVLYWSGLVQSINFDANAIPTIKATLNTASLASVSKRRRTQILCDNALYDSGCRVNKESYKITGTLSSVIGKTLKAAVFATKADGWFIAGQIKIGEARRLIKSHVGDTITISRPVISAEIGNSFTAYAGCDHSFNTCWEKFHNSFNSGDHRFLPSKNPAAGIMNFENQPYAPSSPSFIVG